EIGAPLASLYLLNNPDHYTDHMFQHLPWRKFVNWVQKDIDSLVANEEEFTDEEDDNDDSLQIKKVHGKYVALSPVVNYIHCPKEYETMCVYDWVRLHHKEPLAK
ncbi:hypothetical protein GYMLUDRAFT_140075, partial [Collybiopsis luxurians FD-317 M1]